VQKLIGVTLVNPDSMDHLKKLALLFDHLHIVPEITPPFDETSWVEMAPLFRFLESEGLINKEKSYIVVGSLAQEAYEDWQAENIGREGIKISDDFWPSEYNHLSAQEKMLRLIAKGLVSHSEDTVVPVCSTFPPIGKEDTEAHSLENVLRVTLKAMPLPGETCAWDDILDFKTEAYEQGWNLRRFLRTLATKKQTEGEIRDGIEWCLEQYSQAMKRRRWLTVKSAVTAFVVPAITLLEDPASKHPFSLAIATSIAIAAMKMELYETEAKAVGRECAYIFNARRLGDHTSRKS
jgi:hypothetical protein